MLILNRHSCEVAEIFCNTPVRCDFSIYFGGGVPLPAMLGILSATGNYPKALSCKSLWVMQIVSGWCNILISRAINLPVEERRMSVKESRA